MANGLLHRGPRHGGSGSSSSSIILSENERIVRVEGSTDGTVINHLFFISNDSNGDGNRYGPFGTTGQVHFSAEGYILGFRGKANDSDVTSLAVYYLRPLIKDSKTFGGTGRTYSSFDDNVDAFIPPVIGIKTITIRHGVLIDSFQCTYILLAGGFLVGNQHGGAGGESITLRFKKDEILEQVIGSSYQSYLGRLTLYTSLRGDITKHGYYGIMQQESFHISGNILGFHGFEEFIMGSRTCLISRIGVYTV